MSDAPIVVADDAIGWVHEAFGPLATVRLRPGAAIRRADLHDAAGLLVRTVTRVDADLVRDTPLRFVGSATAGEDHLQREALEARGITVAHAAGCNATAVAEFVLAAIAEAEHRRGRAFLGDGPFGVIGFGACGRRLTVRLRALGVDVRVCDPPLAASRDAPHEPDAALRAMIADERFFDLHELLASCRAISLHVPRTRTTLGMIDAAALQTLPDGALVINAARGGVVQDDALADFIARGRVDAVLDVWQTEPSPSPALLDRVLVATPHVAGYSLEGKVEATRRIAVAFARHLGGASAFDAAAILATGGALALPDVTAASPRAAVREVLRSAIDVAADDAALRGAMAAAGPDAHAGARAFEALRRGYAFRRELAAFRVRTDIARHELAALGVTIIAD